MSRVESAYIFSSYLKISYDKRFIPTAIDTVKNLAALSGADEKEIYHLSMLAEESLVFIIDKYIDDKLKAHIDLGFMLFSDGRVVLELSDTGTPIHKETIPEFNIDKEDTVDGLWFHMVQQLSDSFEIINLLNKGWVIRIEKKIKDVSFSGDSINQSDEAKHSKPVFRMAVPSDAAKLIDLAFMTYRYSNSVPEYYDEKKLSEHIAKGEYDIIVAEVDGMIGGAVSFKYHQGSVNCAEMGSAMIHPDFRGSRLSLMLVKELNRYHDENPKSADFFICYLVTTHIRSQKPAERIGHGYKPMAIPFNMIPRPNYIGIKDMTDTREAQLNAYHFNKAISLEKIYTPEKHAEIVAELISNAGCDAEISSEYADADGVTDLRITQYKSAVSAVIDVNHLGADWYTSVVKAVISALADGSRTVMINFVSASPLPDSLDSKMDELNFVFCGLTPYSLEDFRLSYIFSADPVDFDAIQIFNPSANKLFDHIKDQYKG